MCGRPLIGLVAALLVEARHWVRLRWDFDDSSYESAWQLSLVLLVLTGVVIWLNESRHMAVLSLMTWMPVMVLPLQFVQSYGMKQWMDLGAFSMFAKRSRVRNQRLGLMVNPVRVNFGNVLLVVTLLAATVGADKQSPVFLPGLVLLSGWALLATRMCRWQLLLPVMLVTGLLALAGGMGLAKLEHWLRWNRAGDNNQYNSNFHTTLIGERGRVDLSPEVIWRMKVHGAAPPPQLLRTAVFSNYMAVSWQNQRSRSLELDPVLIDEESYYLLRDDLDTTVLAELPWYTLRGSVRNIYPLPLDSSAMALRGFKADRVEKSAMGVLKVTPDEPVVECSVLRKRGVNSDGPPEDRELLWMSPRERDTIEQVVRELKLDELPDIESKLVRLKQWFASNFSYTLDLTIQQRPSPAPTALSQFLTDVRAGHCEYFASAATLILREAGVPTRYAIGYAVIEQDLARGDYVIRGSHSHAWCRVWDTERRAWFDFDPTPPGWYDGFPRSDTWSQKFQDWLKRIREDFYLWRTNPDNEVLLMWVIVGIGLLLGGWVVSRLWRSRDRIEDAAGQLHQWDGDVVLTPLHGLERLLRMQLGPRPLGQTFVHWLGALHDRIEDPAMLDEMIALHQQLRFDPQPTPEDKLERLRLLVGELEKQLTSLSAPEVVDHS